MASPAASDEVLHNEDLLRGFLELACTGPAEAAAVAGVARAWAAASAGARLHATLVGRGTAAASALRRLSRCPPRGAPLAELLVVAGALGEGALAAAVEAADDLRAAGVALCFGAVLAASAPGCLRTWAALAGHNRLAALTLADVAHLAWPRGVTLPALAALALTNSALVLAPEDGGGGGGGEGGAQRGGACSSLAEVVRSCPRLQLLAVGGTRLLRSRGDPPPRLGGGPGPGAGPGHSYNPLAEGVVDAAAAPPPGARAAIARQLVSGGSGEHGLVREGTPPPAPTPAPPPCALLSVVEATFQPAPLAAAMAAEWPSAAVIDLTDPDDVSALVRGLHARGTYLPPRRRDTAPRMRTATRRRLPPLPPPRAPRGRCACRPRSRPALGCPPSSPWRRRPSSRTRA